MSPLKVGQHAGLEGAFYVHHHRYNNPRKSFQYRLVEISKGGMLVVVEKTDPDVRIEREMRRSLLKRTSESQKSFQRAYFG